MDAVRLHFYQYHPVLRGWWESLLLPFYATFRGLEGAPGYGASTGPLLLALGIFTLFGWRSFLPGGRRALSSAAIVTLVGLVIWAMAMRLSDLLAQSRLYLALFPALALLAGAGYAALPIWNASGVRLGRLAGAGVLLVLWLGVLQIGMKTLASGALPTVLGLQAEKAYLESNLGQYALAMQAVDDLPAGSQVLLLFEPRSLYCQPRCEPDEVLDRWIQARATLADPAVILASWRAAGYTHLLYYRQGAEFIRQDDNRYDPADWTALDSLFGLLSMPVDFGGAYQLYSLAP